MNKLLEVSGLRLSLDGSTVLHSLDLHVGKGEIVGLVGENGSGKTMTLRSIVGLEQPKADKLFFKRESLLELPTHKRIERGLGYCPSEDNVFPRMSVRENLEMGSYLNPKSTGNKLRQVSDMFPSLEERMGERATTLSGGERQMLALGKALMSSPEILLLDEFSLGLSQENAIEFSGRIKDIYASGVSVLFVEQNFHLAADLAKRDYYMVEGKIVKRGVLSSTGPS
ncbi:ATP-binding cassette domain-containing protein [Candidatus Bipolaricaulota bacterium]|nr:ATP-binding cassette domain-containing protein [Candidatus Bipolaricaulota bacterium]